MTEQAVPGRDGSLRSPNVEYLPGLATNELGVQYCLECEHKPCNDENAKKKPRMQKNYIRQQKSEKMGEFTKEGGTFTSI